MIVFPTTPQDGALHLDTATGVWWVCKHVQLDPIVLRWAKLTIQPTFVQDAQPIATKAGQFWYAPATGALKCWTGTEWGATASGVTDHALLTNLQGGAVGDLQHLTAAQVALLGTAAAIEFHGDNPNGATVVFEVSGDVATGSGDIRVAIDGGFVDRHYTGFTGDLLLTLGAIVNGNGGLAIFSPHWSCLRSGNVVTFTRLTPESEIESITDLSGNTLWTRVQAVPEGKFVGHTVKSSSGWRIWDGAFWGRMLNRTGLAFIARSSPEKNPIVDTDELTGNDSANAWGLARFSFNSIWNWIVSKCSDIFVAGAPMKWAGSQSAMQTNLGGKTAGTQLFVAENHSGAGSTRKLMGLDVTDFATFSRLASASNIMALDFNTTDGYIGYGTYQGSRNGGISWKDASNTGVSLFVGNYAHRIFMKTANGNVGLGTVTPDERLHVVGNAKVSGFIEGIEVLPPVSPAANGYRIYAEDSGGGKTRLMVLFATGAAVQLAIEP